MVHSMAQAVINVVPMEKGKREEAAVTGAAKYLTGMGIPLRCRRESEDGGFYTRAHFTASAR
ncbi:DUF4426 domain-containing protein, partial [Pseudomonas aeruginosa]